MTPAAVLALFVSAVILVRQRFRVRADEAVLFGSTLAMVEVVVLMQALGLASALRPAPVWVATLGCVAAHVVVSLWHCPWRPLRRYAPVPRFLRPAAIGASLTAGVRLFLAWKTPPEGWDSLGYHLPIVLNWIQKANFDLAGWAGSQRYYAWNGELAAAWLALLSGSLDYAKLVQVLSLPLFVSAGAVLGRRLAGLRWAWPCALGVGAIPIVLIHAGIAYVDALHASFWLAAAASAVSLARSGRTISLWAFAASFGLALGTKSTFFFLAPLVLLLVVGLLVSPRGFRPALPQWLVALGLVLLAGAGAYVRNLILTGNPIYPYGLSIGGLTIFRGIASAGDFPAYFERWFVSSRWAWVVYPFWERIQGVVGYSHLNGFGPLFAVGWLLVPLSAWNAWKRRQGLVLAFLGLIPLVLLLFFLVQPVQILRYIIFLAPLPTIGLACLLGRVQGGLRRAACAVWSAAILLGCAGVVAYLWRSPGMRSAASQLLRGRSVDAWDYYQKQYPALGRAWQALDRRLCPGDLVAVNYPELLLPWYGMPPRARVRVVTLGECPYPQCLSGRTAARWLERVEGLAARFVVVWRPAWNPGREDVLPQELGSRPDRFQSIGRWESGDFGRVVIYERPRR